MGIIRPTVQKQVLYPELSYQITGSLFDVYNQIGYGHKEVVYQRALASEFSKRKIIYSEQLLSKIDYKGTEVGKYYFDFLVDGRVVVELKVRDFFSKKDIEQLYSYLKSKNLKLGIIAHFTKSGVRHKRIVNII